MSMLPKIMTFVKFARENVDRDEKKIVLLMHCGGKSNSLTSILEFSDYTLYIIMLPLLRKMKTLETLGFRNPFLFLEMNCQKNCC